MLINKVLLEYKRSCYLHIIHDYLCVPVAELSSLQKRLFAALHNLKYLLFGLFNRQFVDLALECYEHYLVISLLTHALEAASSNWVLDG